MRNSKRKQRSSYSENKVQFIRGGAPYFKLLDKLIRSARETIHFQTYIFDDDETGRAVADALIAASQKQVKVYLLVDGYASQNLPKPFIENLRNAGVNFRFFEPIFKSRNFYFGRRLHNKVVVIDTEKTLVGGVNITNRYNDMPEEPAWLDFALYAEGPISRDACIQCWKTWKSYLHKRPAPCDEKEINLDEQTGDIAQVRIRRNDWVRNQLQISNSYLEMFRTAKSNITILSSYALPGYIFRSKLEKAVKRGVKVKMIISGSSDVMLVKNAERYWYDWLMRNNIEIFEYKKTVLHGKLAICDDEWMTIGSYNVNNLSAYASIELNLDVQNPVFIKKVDAVLEEIIKNDCILISKETYKRTNHLFKRFSQWFSYNLIRVTLGMFTFYYRKQKS